MRATRVAAAAGFGTLNAAMVLALFEAIGVLSFRDAPLFSAFLWPASVLAAWFALIGTDDLLRVDLTRAVILATKGAVAGALIGVGTVVAVAAWSADTRDPMVPLVVPFASLYAVTLGGTVGFLCAAADVAILSLARLARRGIARRSMRAKRGTR